MTLKVDRPAYWSPTLIFDLRKGWPQEPPEGTELGRLHIDAAIPAGTTFEYRGLSFRGDVKYIKNINHNAPPTYDFEVARGVYANDIPESEVPTEVLVAFAEAVDTMTHWGVD